MNIITMASRKGGAGKSTITAHLAALCHQGGFRTLVIDADPQGSLTLWHSLRPDRQPDLRSGARGIERALAMAVVDGYQWVFIDTAASMWVVAQEAIRAATMVLIPARPGFFDLNAVRETVAAARERNKPYAVVLNATPVKRDDKEAPAVLQSRAFFEGLGIPVWGGQVNRLRAHTRGRRQHRRGGSHIGGRFRDEWTMVGSRTLGRRHQCGACGTRREQAGGSLTVTGGRDGATRFSARSRSV
jgi:chromosome partitioning protein